MRRVAGLVIPLLALASCARPGGKVPGSFPKAPLVVVSIDTLRSVHLPAYGYRGVETPAIDGFRKDAILFEKAYTHAPLTLPAHASLFTGLLPAGHGLRDNAGYRLKAGVPTLAELLKGAGYRTGAAVSAVVLGGGTGLSRGFDFYEDSIEPTEQNQPQSRVQRAGEKTSALLTEWIARGGDAPLFAFLHLYEPHAPYEPPEPFRSRYENRYDGEIATADAILGKFVQFLREKGLYDRALVIVLSDHGEGLGEHGEEEHGVFVYRSDLQIPLLVKLPKVGGGFPLAGTSAAAPVQISDVFTTVGRALALPGLTPPEGTVSLLDAAAGKTPADRRVFAESLYPRLRFGWSDLASLIDGTWQLIEAPRVEFYDVAKDPAERTNLAADKPGPFRAMRLELEKRRAAFEAASPVGAEEAKKLAALGYLTGSAAAPAGPLADPKDEIGLLADLGEMRARALAGRPEEALGAIRRILDRNPRMLDVWETYAQILRDRGRLEEALAARRRMVELSPPDATLPLLGVANLCLDLGRTDEAIRNAQLARERGDEGASEVLARAFLAKGDLAAAETAGRAAAEVGRTRIRSRLVLGRIALAKGDHAGALREVEAAREAAGGEPPPGYHELRGEIFALSGKPAEAEKELREEIRRSPGDPDPRFSLGLLLAARGRRDEARRVVLEAVALAPSLPAYEKGIRTLTYVGDRSGAEALRREAGRRFPGGRTPAGNAGS